MLKLCSEYLPTNFTTYDGKNQNDDQRDESQQRYH